MDTVMTIRYTGEEKLLSECGKIISDLEKKLSVTDKGSLIYALNEKKEPIRDEEVVALVKKSLELSTLTSGMFDPTVYPLVKLWGFTTGEYKVPTEEEIEALLPYIGKDKVSATTDVVTASEGAQIDLGGIAKGYLSDVLRERLIINGVKSALLNLGGNVTAIGDKDGSGWKIGIKNPLGEGYFGIVNVSDEAVVTSGLYERHFVSDGKKYGHIIDPTTGSPVENDLLSVTVVGKSGTECDAFSTALFVMGREKATVFLKEHRIDAVLYTNDGVLYTEGLQGRFSLQPNFSSLPCEVIRW
ncbi:MAG: FAD:protein FMN transferase [Clostridia bacterium]|nr:FAD:protein FMN transferase [Clostridia bacterium]